MLTDADTAYITTHFLALTALAEHHGHDPAGVRGLIADGRLPRPSYTLDDGTEMVPPDYFELLGAGSPDDLETRFKGRYSAAAREHGRTVSDDELQTEWEGYLSGDYGVCLRSVTPENVCGKGWHMGHIERLIVDPRRDAADWRRALAEHVDALDRLERPFAPCDRMRWGAVSRDRLITAVRDRYPEVFGTAAEPSRPGVP